MPASDEEPASSPVRPAAPRPGATRAPLTALRGGVNSPEASGAISIVVAAAILLAVVSLAHCQLHTFLAELIETLELVATERTCDAVACELDWWTLVGRLVALAGRWACRPLKFALVTVFAAYVVGWVERYVLPVLRFFWQIPW
jgi:hypothetical protein